MKSQNKIGDFEPYLSHAQALVVDFAVVLWAKMRIRLTSPATKVTRAVYTCLCLVLLV